MADERKAKLRQLLFDYMQQRGLSARQLGKEIGLSQTSVLGYLDGSTYPGAESRAAIARILGYTPAELDAHLEGVPLVSQKPIEELLAEIRALDQGDFLRVAQVVWNRLVAEFERQG